MKKFNYYYDYSPEAYNYIMQSKILRQSEKNLLKDMVEGKKIKIYECKQYFIRTFYGRTQQYWQYV